jgi:ATP-dependent Clp protease ATP-binding subunit ClpA
MAGADTHPHRAGQVDRHKRAGLLPDAELELSRVLREVHWQMFGWRPAPDVPSWEDEARESTRRAMAVAVARGAPWVGPDHLLEALLDDPATAASRFVRRQGVDLELLTEVARRTWPEAGGAPPRRALSDMLGRAGVLIEGGPRPALKQRLTAGTFRLVGQAGPTLVLLEDEAVAETVRMGHDRTTATHLILAVLLLEEELTDRGPEPGDMVLGSFGLDRCWFAASVAPVAQVGDLAAPQRRRAWRTSPRNPPWTRTAARMAEAARHVARADRRVDAGSGHLLYAVLTDPDDTGRRLLREHAVDPAAVTRLLARRLGLAGATDG